MPNDRQFWTLRWQTNQMHNLFLKIKNLYKSEMNEKIASRTLFEIFQMRFR